MGAVYRHSLNQGIYALAVILGAVLGSNWGLQGVATAVLVAIASHYALMLALCGSLLAIEPKKLVAVHLPGLWLSLWTIGVTSLHDYLFTGIHVNSFSRLGLNALLAIVGVSLGMQLAPRIFRLSLCDWLLGRVQMEKLGKMGSFVEFFLRRLGKNRDFDAHVSS